MQDIILAALPFPQFDPVAIQFGPIAIRWYALSYVVGIWGAFKFIKRMNLYATPYGKGGHVTNDQIDGFVSWAILGILIGGRLGYVLFYNLPYFIENPTKIIAIWEGGMSFHGGFIGTVLALLYYERSKLGLRLFRFTDRMAVGAPIGLGLGRLANFINGELYGRETDVAWAFIFPSSAAPRHPSQLYEAFLEGVVLLCVMWYLCRFHRMLRKRGLASAVLLIGYGAARFTVEFVREPDPQLGFLFSGATMGQLLSTPMILLGLGIIYARWQAKQAR
ncbi:MAG: prolipoprotein diacylglyceryl transferase [Alphaproteobacteria bacterium]|nr:prolipoprotein diacylglyceryl transferase [Alphaproteobacteria bacterium]